MRIMDIKSVRKKISGLLMKQKLGVLATLGKDHPYQSIVAFSASRDMKHILFATKRATAKYKNLKNKARVSVFIDDRSNQEADFVDAAAMTALGDARELSGSLRKKHMKLFLHKHPALKTFLVSPDCALFMVKVKVYYVVLNFQEVTEVRMK